MSKEEACIIRLNREIWRRKERREDEKRDGG